MLEPDDLAGARPQHRRVSAQNRRSPEARLRRPRYLLRRPGIRQYPLATSCFPRNTRRSGELKSRRALPLEFRAGTLAGQPGRHPSVADMAHARIDDELMARDTTCVNAIDKDGVMFSATPSGAWLPSVIAGDTGIPLTQRAQSFLLVPGHPNELAGGKRPRVTLSPTLVTRGGKPAMTLSTPGGDNQDQALLQVFLDVVEFGMNAQNAVEAPRFQTRHLVSSFDNHAMNRGDLLLDERIPANVYSGSDRRGHKTSTRSRWSSGAYPILIRVLPNGAIEAGADPTDIATPKPGKCVRRVPRAVRILHFSKAPRNRKNWSRSPLPMTSPAIAVLDRDGVYGSVRQHLAAKKLGIRAHIGAEITCTDGTCLPSALRIAAGISKSLPADYASEDARRRKAKAPRHAKRSLSTRMGSSVLPEQMADPARNGISDLRQRSCTMPNCSATASRTGSAQPAHHRTRRAAEDPAAGDQRRLARHPGAARKLSTFSRAFARSHARRRRTASDTQRRAPPEDLSGDVRLLRRRPAAIANTVELSDRLQFTLRDLGYEFPRLSRAGGPNDDVACCAS